MKTDLLFAATTLLGAAAICWMGMDFIDGNMLALAVTVVIGLVFALGTIELVQYRTATSGLRNGLGALESTGEDHLATLLAALPRSLQGAVRQRVEGEHGGLPAPVFCPYLVGLLVMLGLLGTFVGMVDTLHGAVVALEGSTELSAVRAGLAAPIQGLGLAFGTSVAGVAASAMLGLNNALSRRERVVVTRELDRQVAGGPLREYSLGYNRQQTYQVLQQQAETLPEIARHLADLAGTMERTSRELGETLLSNQQKFHEHTRGQFTDLAQSVDASLQKSLAESGRLAGESLAPVMESTLEKLHALQGDTAGKLQDIQQRTSENLQGLQHATAQSLDAVQSAASGQLHKLQLELTVNLDRLEEHTAQRLDQLEASASRHLDALGRSLEEPMARLIETAAEAPRAAAEVISGLRQEVSDSLARDTRLLGERQQILEDLAALSNSLQQASADQQRSISDLVASSTLLLRETSDEFRDHLSGETSRLAEITANAAGSSADIASLGESFALAVQLFSDSNKQLIENLNRIEQSMAASSERSDEQMGYYVAQAREIIDHSMLSQREIIEELRRPGPGGDLLTAEAS